MQEFQGTHVVMTLKKEDMPTEEYIKQIMEPLRDEFVKRQFLNELAEEIMQVNTEKGFNDAPVHTGEAIALMHSELSEALEADRKDLMDDKLPHRSGVEVELADAIIRILHFSARKGFDIHGAVREKLDYNKTRPYKHGKKY